MPHSLGFILSAAVLIVAGGLLLHELRRRLRRSGEDLLVSFLLAADRIYCTFWFRLELQGRLRVPARGAAIVIANHTSPLDPLALQCATSRNVGFFFAREYYDIFGLRWIWRRLGCIPVNRTGYDASATKAGLRRLAAGKVVGVFPEGRINLDGSGLLPGRYGAAMLALRARVPVVPAVITGPTPGRSMILPYFIPCHIRIQCGDPIDLRRYYDRPIDRQLLSEVTSVLMAALARLGGMQCPAPYRGRVPPINVAAASPIGPAGPDSFASRPPNTPETVAQRERA